MTQAAPPNADLQTLRLGHSPDPDDAFMWWPLADFVGPDGQTYTPQIDTGGYRFVHVLEDIQSLNDRSEKAELEVTAISIHQYPFVAKDYALTACGSSMGDGYGPMIVSKQPLESEQLRGVKLAIPGWRTTAWLSCQLFLAELGMTAKDVQAEVVEFDQIIEAVLAGKYDAGLIIHEGQITYQDQGVSLVRDLGLWWGETRNLPLPLGGNAIRRDLGDALPAITRILKDSIEHALANRDDAVRFALQYGRGLDTALADRFVGMYVNDVTLDYGERGRAAVQQLMDEAVAANLVPALPGGAVDFIDPA
ncbi:MAG: MqnA/MqnD/SBP family protein [Planctomycetota bacterium]